MIIDFMGCNEFCSFFFVVGFFLCAGKGPDPVILSPMTASAGNIVDFKAGDANT
jgi:hypothetical protein